MGGKSRNMVTNFVKNVIFFLQIFRKKSFVKKRQKYPSKCEISSQNCKDFPPKAKFPGNEITKFQILSMPGNLSWL